MTPPRDVLLPTARLVTLAGVLAALAILPVAFAPLVPLWQAAALALVALAAADALALPRGAALTLQRLAVPPLLHARPARLAIELGSRARGPLAVRVADSIPAELAPVSGPRSVTLAAAGTTRLEWDVVPLVRGDFRWSVVFLFWRSALGLMERRRVVELPAAVQVHPDIAAILAGHRLDPQRLLAQLGVKRTARRGAGMDFESLREFQPGDEVARVDWKATARRGAPVTRLYQVEQNHEVLILIDSGRLMLGGGEVRRELAGSAASGAGGERPAPRRTKVDEAVDAAILLALVALEHGDRVGMVTFSDRVERQLLARRQREQLRALVGTLYAVAARPVESDYRRLLATLSRTARKRALVVLLTDFTDAETAEEMAAAVRELARRHLVLLVALRDPAIERELAAPLPSLDRLLGKVVARNMLADRARLLEELGRAGVATIDAPAASAAVPLVERYLALRPAL